MHKTSAIHAVAPLDILVLSNLQIKQLALAFRTYSKALFFKLNKKSKASEEAFENHSIEDWRKEGS